MIILNRRHVLGGLGAVAVTGLAGPAFASQAIAGFQMWHAPGCGCCLEWAKRVEAAFGRTLKVIEAPNMAAVKRAHGVPGDLQSCHTALIGTVIVEGHVPPADIRRLIDSGNKARAGLAVPGMPIGSPGMDVGHDRKAPFKVYAFNGKGARSVFASYN